MAGNEAFQTIQGQGWSRGLSNLLRGELGSWFGRRRWLTNSLIWIAVVDAVLLMVVLQARTDPEFNLDSAGLDMLVLYTLFGGLFVGVGVIIAMQGSVVGEKNNGTAAWILSKPVSRSSFVLAKAIGNGIGLLFTAVLVPGVIAYLVLSFLLYGQPLPVFDFLAGMAVIGLHALFWMAFTLMLGTFFNSWAPVIGIPMVLLFGQQFIAGMIFQSIYVIPYTLVAPLGDQIMSIAGDVIQGRPPFSLLPIYSTIVLTALCLVVAVLRFRREEL